MMTPLPRHVHGHTSGPKPAATYSQSTAERLLHAIGADPRFTEAVFGDLAEEYALRVARDGAASARWWYGCEVLRSAPNFVSSWLRYASRHERARLTAVLGGLVLTSLVLVFALPADTEIPTRLFAGTSDTVIVNSQTWEQLPVRVLDSAGRNLKVTGVRYRQISGAPLRMSAAGLVKCEQRGDALVRATLGALSKDFMLRCRPIDHFVRWTGALSLVVGDPAQQLPVKAVGVDGTPETILAGTAIVGDSDVVSLDGLSVRPKTPGGTMVYVWIGGIVAIIPIMVYKRVNSSAELREMEYFAVSPLRLARGESREWPVLPGKYFVSFRSDTIGSAALTFSAIGAKCSPFGDAYTYFCTVAKSAAFVVSAPAATSRAHELNGYLAIRRQ
ncbi:MAG: permease prefix domain 2-containing transporter [Gemmatimonadaceae bacterium]